MDETPNPQLQKEEEKKDKKKGVLNKLQDITPDKEEQIAIIPAALTLDG